MKFSLKKKISKLTIIRACISYVKNTEAFLVLHQGFNSLSDNRAGLARTKDEILSRTEIFICYLIGSRVTRTAFRFYWEGLLSGHYMMFACTLGQNLENEPWLALRKRRVSAAGIESIWRWRSHLTAWAQPSSLLKLKCWTCFDKLEKVATSWPAPDPRRSWSFQNASVSRGANLLGSNKRGGTVI